MNITWSTLIHWAPRVLTVVFALFLGVFALDVFDHDYGFWRTILAFLIHLIPSGLVLAALTVSWFWPRVGAGLFAGLAVWYVVTTGGRMHWSAYALIAGPLLLLAGLFLLDGYLQRRMPLGN